MRTHFGLPANNYVIILNKEELERLLNNKHISIEVGRTPCTTSRAVFNDEKTRLDFMDRKEIHNDLRFYLNEDVADNKSGDYSVQFLNIALENESED